MIYLLLLATILFLLYVILKLVAGLLPVTPKAPERPIRGTEIRFPDSFLFGVGTATQQMRRVRTDPRTKKRTQWDRFLKEKADDLAKQAGAETDFGGFGPLPPEIWENLKGKLTDSKNYLGHNSKLQSQPDEEYKRMADLGLNLLRCNVPWEEVEPSSGEFDNRNLKKWVAEIDSQINHGITPVIVLNHWTYPLWFDWEHENAVEHFVDFSAKIAQAVGDRKVFWLTHNEPEVYLNLGYFLGQWPPFKKNLLIFGKLRKVWVEAHNRAYEQIHAIKKDAMVGVGQQMALWETPSGPLWPIRRLITYILFEKQGNHWFLEQGTKAKTLDFIGVQYYLVGRVAFNKFPFGTLRVEGKQVSDYGWSVDPRGICRLLLELKKYNLPVGITENGVADHDDDIRGDFIRETLIGVWQAMEAGVEVRFYTYWCWPERQIEWDKGMAMDFSLLNPDGSLRDSAKLLGEIATSKTLVT